MQGMLLNEHLGTREITIIHRGLLGLGSNLIFYWSPAIPGGKPQSHGILLAEGLKNPAACWGDKEHLMPGRKQSSFSGCWVIGADFPAASPSPDITAARRAGGGGTGDAPGPRAGAGSGSRGAAGRDSCRNALPGAGGLSRWPAVMTFPAVFTGGSGWARGEPEREPALRESPMWHFGMNPT